MGIKFLIIKNDSLINLITIISFALILSTYATAADIFSRKTSSIETETITQSSYTIYLEGKIEKGDFEKIRTESRGKIIKNIELWSPGGNVQEALKISEFLNNKLISAHAPDFLTNEGKTIIDTCNLSDVRPRDKANCTCNSSCAIIWLLAPFRLGTIVGIHRPRFDYDDYSGMTTEQAKMTFDQMVSEIKTKLVEGQVNPKIVEIMFNTSSSNIHYLTFDEIVEIGARKSFIDELINARCQKHILELQNYNSFNLMWDEATNDFAKNCHEMTTYCKKLVNKIGEMARDFKKMEPVNFNKCQSRELNKLLLSSQIQQPGK